MPCILGRGRATLGRLHQLFLAFITLHFAVYFIIIILPAAIVGTMTFHQLLSGCFYGVIFWVNDAIL